MSGNEQAKVWAQLGHAAVGWLYECKVNEEVIGNAEFRWLTWTSDLTQVTHLGHPD